PSCRICRASPRAGAARLRPAATCVDESRVSMDQLVLAASPGFAAPLVRVDHLRHVYCEGGAGDLLVLDDVSIALADNEIVGLLGRWRSGKATMQRIIAGLMPPTNGAVAIAGHTVDGPADDVAMVFQSFALFPWRRRRPARRPYGPQWPRRRQSAAS